jgi:hypothetical protein
MDETNNVDEHIIFAVDKEGYNFNNPCTYKGNDKQLVYYNWLATKLLLASECFSDKRHHNLMFCTMTHSALLQAPFSVDNRI